ncbi:peroxiredoxin family protein [Kineobactrum salinum]|uniref:Peroxiredoxin n=1 Tax=Kineobactrum salinum TaxID=2708301 RepID=A0A6C0TYG8_9GAMM|nr:peroxiredoxin [Kineobactrum salinum]QIB64439.1 peroxiredoxin [Kineobactrum salinum]
MKLYRSLFLLMLGLVLPATLSAAELQVGDPAPAFSLEGSDGKTYRLADFKGKQAVVLAWFPRAFTSGCTVECKSLAENGHLIRAFDVSYFMASVDPLAKNKAFAEDTGADFPLLSDPDKSVARAYGVLAPAGYARRHTFYIDREGTIVRIDSSIEPATAAQDMAAALAELGVARR